jgi:hypothetical protein
MEHGDHDKCGSEYRTNESTRLASCPFCEHVFAPHERQGEIVKVTAKLARTWGRKHTPVDGRIVGVTGPWPIVQWSDGHTFPIATEGLVFKGKVDISAL